MHKQAYICDLEENSLALACNDSEIVNDLINILGDSVMARSEEKRRGKYLSYSCMND
jgi:hypothetical protein